MTKITVTNSRQDGYRRGGIELKRGKNELDAVSDEALKALQADPCLTVTIVSDQKPTAELADIVVIALACEDKTIYFNKKDGSPRIAKWQEETGNKSLTKDEVIAAITAFEATKKPTLQQVAVTALSCEDKTIYFNNDGSPVLAKWQEDTGNESLTAEEIASALEAASETE